MIDTASLYKHCSGLPVSGVDLDCAKSGKQCSARHRRRTGVICSWVCVTAGLKRGPGPRTPPGSQKPARTATASTSCGSGMVLADHQAKRQARFDGHTTAWKRIQRLEKRPARFYDHRDQDHALTSTALDAHGV